MSSFYRNAQVPTPRLTLAILDLLPTVRVARLSEVRSMIEARRLYNASIGLTDAHLIAAAFINPATLLWTRDKQFRKVAEGLGYTPIWAKNLDRGRWVDFGDGAGAPA